jgi:hypothetical protein
MILCLEPFSHSLQEQAATVLGGYMKLSLPATLADFGKDDESRIY